MCNGLYVECSSIDKNELRWRRSLVWAPMDTYGSWRPIFLLS